MVNVATPPVGGQVANITLSTVQSLVTAAINEWLATGLTASQAEAIEHAQVRVADLPPGYLGFTSGNVIWIDQNAAGYGWFVDATPADSSEFTYSADGQELIATPESAAYGRIDLLTVVAHELGHVLGLGDDNGSDLMGEFLSTGIRRLPVAVVPASTASVDRSGHAEPAVAQTTTLMSGLGQASTSASNTSPVRPGLAIVVDHLIESGELLSASPIIGLDGGDFASKGTKTALLRPSQHNAPVPVRVFAGRSPRFAITGGRKGRLNLDAIDLLSLNGGRD